MSTVEPQPSGPAARDHAAGAEMSATLAALDWHDFTCQSNSGCTNRATHVVHRHAVDECDRPNADPFGNFVDILCIGCVRTVKADALQQVSRYARFPGAYCLTCGGPLNKLNHIMRRIVQLRTLP
jgi:hypothetical protein